MSEVKYNPALGAPTERIANRLRNCGSSASAGGKNVLAPTYSVKTGSGPTRVVTNVHENHGQHGSRIANAGGNAKKGTV
jgi:hypothetical protein